VDAFDASPELAKLASTLIGQPVEVMSFADFDRHQMYDGIWACASLIHVPVIDLAQTMQRLWRIRWFKVVSCTRNKSSWMWQ
jgi:hypothetical protein